MRWFDGIDLYFIIKHFPSMKGMWLITKPYNHQSRCFGTTTAKYLIDSRNLILRHTCSVSIKDKCCFDRIIDEHFFFKSSLEKFDLEEPKDAAKIHLNWSWPQNHPYDNVSILVLLSS